jgi:hypothetical protein
MNNYDVCTVSRHGRYDERKVGDTEQSTHTHNDNTDDRAITTDQIRELIKQTRNFNIQPETKIDCRIDETPGKLHKETRQV